MSVNGKVMAISVAAAGGALAWLTLAGQPGGQAGGQAPTTQIAPDGSARGITPALIGEIAQSLSEMEGCLGVEVGQFRSGKNLIVGWFENKAAAMRWYNHPTHRKALKQIAYEPDANRVPMADVPDDIGPIMAIACARPLTAEETAARGDGAPFQLGIELYAPVKGGYQFGAFSPEGVKALMEAEAGKGE